MEVACLRHMSKPRQVLAGKTRLLTRRVIERRFFLVPTEALNQLIEYLLAVGCARFGLKLIAIYVASNHYHLLVVDVEGRYPEFLQWFNNMLARALNHYRGRRGQVWDEKPPSAPEILDAQAVLDRACYVLGNPVKDALVRHGRQWPGVRSSPQACLQPPKVVERPRFFFGEKTKLPEKAELVFHVPPEFEHLGAEGWAKRFSDALASFEEEARRKVTEEGRTFMGPAHIKRKSWKSAPKEPEKSGVVKAFHALYIATDKAVRLAAIAAHRAFTRAHEAARQAFLAGDRDALFPHGTYQYPRILGVRCAPPP